MILITSNQFYMEPISALGIVLLGAIVSVLTSWAKKIGMSGQVALGLICLIAASVFAGFKYIADPATTEEIIQFAIFTWGIANMLYSLVYQPAANLISKK